MSGGFEEKKVAGRLVYSGPIFHVRSDLVILPDGKTSTRDYVEHPGASVIVPFQRGRVLMVYQYRYPVCEHLYELPAGRLDPHEDPERCALRELEEETGYTASAVRYIFSVYSSPGFTNEVLHFFLATGLRKLEKAPEMDEDEFIKVEWFPLREIGDMVLSGKIKDAKTLIGLLWLLSSEVPGGGEGDNRGPKGDQA